MNESSISSVINMLAMDNCMKNCSHLGRYNAKVQNCQGIQKSFIEHAASIHFIFYQYLVPLLIPIVLILLIYKLWEAYIISTRDHMCSRPLPPGTFGFPIVGETLEFLLKGRQFFDSRRNAFGKIYKTHLLGRPTIRVIGVKIARQILANENTLVTSQWPKSTRMLLGKGSLSVSSGNSHAFRKKVIMKAFTGNSLNTYAPVVQEIIVEYIGKWCKEKQVFGYPEFRSLTFELACRVLLGIEMDKQEKNRLMDAFEKFLRNLFSLPICLPGTGLYQGMKARRTLLEKIEECIKQKQINGPVNGFADALSLMSDIDGDEKLSLEELKEVGLELLFAGHETTSSAACTLVLQLSKHPEVLIRIVEELALHGLTGYNSRCINLETINKLKYLKNVIKEVLRITPPIGGGFRKALQTFEVDGFQIPKGWTVAYAIRDSHETDSNIGSPEVFNPDRWDDINGSERDYFLSFGSGKRGCAGKEFALLTLKILAIELSRSCSWIAVNDNPRLKYLPVPHPVDNLPMEFSEMYDFRPRSLTA